MHRDFQKCLELVVFQLLLRASVHVLGYNFNAQTCTLQLCLSFHFLPVLQDQPDVRMLILRLVHSAVYVYGCLNPPESVRHFQGLYGHLILQL